MSITCPVCGGSVTEEFEACPACGFKLSGSTQKFKAVSVPAEPIRASLNIPSVMRARLRVVKGPQIEMIYDLRDDEQIIGRSPQCDIFLNDMTVSRKHARIFYNGECFVIEDTNSFNGLWINNSSVSSWKLSPGDELQIGVFCLAFEQD